MDEAAWHLLALAVVEGVPSQVTEGLVVGEQVVDGDEHGVADGDHCPTCATARGAAAVVGRQVRARCSTGDVGDLGQCAPQPGIPAARPAAEASAAALGIARAHPRPRSQMRRTGEARPVGADLGDEHLGGALGDTRDALEQRDRVPLGGQALCECGVQTRASRIQVLQVGELLARAGKT